MAGNDSFRLVVRRGPQPNQTFDLNKDVMTIGRDITNDIVINDPEVSRHHLRFTRGGDGFNIEDLGSTNGTFINGQRLTGVRPLNRGDMIGLGETVTLGYEVVRAAGEGAAPTAPGYAAPMQEPRPQQPDVSPYAPPAPERPPQPLPGEPQRGYTPPPQPPYQQPGYGYNQGYEYAPPGGAQQPDYGYAAPAGAPPGYDYDPYAMREEEPRSATRWVLIGCAILSVFCCCSTVVGLVIIDALSLWYDIPIVKDIAPLFERIAEALGLI